MPIGEPSSSTLGDSANFQVNRDRIIYLALLKVGGIEKGGTPDASQLADCAAALNMIVRQDDVKDKNLWAISPDATHLTLVANTARYVTGSSATTIPTNIQELVTAYYRDETGEDHRLKILTDEEYQDIQSKLSLGDPDSVYLQRAALLSNKILFVSPVRNEVNTQSVVTGTDAAAYRCIRSHTADSTNRPVTGANYKLFWEAGGSGAVAWATETQYLAPQQIRFTYRRPLYDFDLSTDRPDFPQAFARYLVYALAYDIADDYSLSIDECRKLDGKRQQAYLTVFPGTNVPDSNNHYNKARDF
jgi:hypothetical protein